MKYFIILLLVTSPFMAQAKILLKDVGIIGLASHDMFAWDHEKEINTENGRLDLSTIFDYANGSRWRKGGNPKNAENAPVWTVTKEIVEFHKEQLKRGLIPSEARKVSVKFFQKMIRESYTRMTTLSFPEEFIDAPVNNVEQAALRALHDILPGRVNTYRGRFFPVKDFALTNFFFARFRLNDKEMNQQIPYFDGDYAQEYKEIKIPFTNKIINLKEIDAKFIEKFSPYRQDEMLAKLKLVGENKIKLADVDFLIHVKELFQKGFCGKDNEWIEDNNCL